MIGILCQAWPPSTREGAKGWQAVVTYELVQAFQGLGIDAQPVVWDASTPGRKYALPVMEHAIVVAELARKAVNQDAEYREALRKMVDGKLCLYLDSPMVGFGKEFDMVFTGEDWGHEDEGFREKHSKFVHAGFGSDEMFHPSLEREDLGWVGALVQYPDPLALRTSGEAWSIIQHNANILGGVAALSFTAPWVTHSIVNGGDRTGQPAEKVGDITKWEGVGRYIPYTQLPCVFNHAKFYLDIRNGALDLTRIDAAYAGALVVVHETNYRKTMHGLIPHKVWKTEEDLIEILNEPTDRYQIAIDARVHTWERVALRMMGNL